MATAKKSAPRKAAMKNSTSKTATSKKHEAPKKVAPPKKAPTARKSSSKDRSERPVPKLAPAQVTPQTSSAQGSAVDAFVARMEGWQQDIVRPLAALIAKEAPGASAYIKWGHPVWDHAGPFALVKAAKAHVTLGFWRGGQMRDADGILEGDSDGMRYVRIQSGQRLPASLAALVHEALALNQKHGDPLKR
ncbi:hypothetical protein FJV41_00160 [Myxococcus llanfairpwllgwyngyllgogerychwyrndrobwllllantysiliogogogochensis]|uniref:YdhG-like domain-containing protein n=1 Tax=Myxococcus llanfairpwllgwyngyllgogerychwyrndrobwllllantysiliogogogochensis TaxID=2590453 RepID=A0A540X9M1_9BACT|nr:DUF1801 domain-containing protein [Myxococcus llanfairpwllgwyngyllgogerychwyrndrobwllllantysiliogogogochensis]TQF17995.1 hypothetical protein FJV41_00160 [Myxococcus llanfairpwllgwyngyllgogerychwyrndrobwllllantysiliogogogochensis]